MNTDNDIVKIIDYINQFVDFLNDVVDTIDIDKSLYKVLKELKHKINNNLVSHNNFITAYTKNEFSLLEADIKKFYTGEAGFPMDESGGFIWEYFTEAQRSEFSGMTDRLSIRVQYINNMIDSFLNIKTELTQNNAIREKNKELDLENKILQQENVTFKNTISNKKVVDLYQGIEVENKKYFNLYRNLFIVTIGLTVFIATTYNPLSSVAANIVELWQAIFYLDYKHSITDGSSLTFNLPTLKYFVFKFSVIIVGITLTTYFLRLSSFYQSKYEQAKQTRLELEAFPDYASLLKPETAEDLRKELALKYFGKDIDKNMIEKNGDLVLEQTRVSTELVKASLDVVKATQPTKP